MNYNWDLGTLVSCPCPCSSCSWNSILTKQIQQIKVIQYDIWYSILVSFGSIFWYLVLLDFPRHSRHKNTLNIYIYMYFHTIEIEILILFSFLSVSTWISWHLRFFFHLELIQLCVSVIARNLINFFSIHKIQKIPEKCCQILLIYHIYLLLFSYLF